MAGAEDGATFDAGMSCWDAVCALLNLWDAHGEDDPTDEQNEMFVRWEPIKHRFEERLGKNPGGARLGITAAELANEAVVEGALATHAAAWAIDMARFTHFSRTWAADKVIDLQDGDLYPVGEWDRDRRPLTQRMSRPWQTTWRSRELPHVRRHISSNEFLPVTFDGSLFHALGFAADVRHVGTGLPNASLADLVVPPAGFPITPGAPEAQREKMLTLTAGAIGAEVDAFVLPELAGHADAIDDLVDLCRASRRPLLVVPGSVHTDADGSKRNVAQLVTADGAVLSHSKRTAFWGADQHEGIDACHEPLRLLVTEDVRILVLICKDLLSERIINTATRYGANLVLVPALSRTLDLHDVTARQLAMRSHALTVIGNGPPDIDGHQTQSLMVASPESDPNRTVYVAAGAADDLVTWHIGGGDPAEAT